MSTPRDWTDVAAERIWDAFLEYDSDERNSMSAGDVVAIIHKAYAAQPRPGIQARAIQERANLAARALYVSCVLRSKDAKAIAVTVIAQHFSDLEPQAELREAAQAALKALKAANIAGESLYAAPITKSLESALERSK